MTERNTLPNSCGRVYPAKRRFTGGHAALAIVAFLVIVLTTTCEHLPDDYSRLRSQGAAINERIETTP